MKNMTKRTVSLISAVLLCAGSTVSAFAEAAQNPYLRGDINRDGAVTVEDAQLALIAYTNQVAKKPTGLNDLQMLAVNVLSDGAFDLLDVQCILKYYVENNVSKRNVSWDQVTGRDQLTVPDTGDELVISVINDNADVRIMIEQFVERHPEYKNRIRMEVLSQPDENGYSNYSVEDFENYLASSPDPDIFCLSCSIMFNSLNNDAISLPVSALGFKESDFANMYPYTLEAGTSLNGDLKALTPTASPCGFAYRTDLAEKYLGVKTPDEMQKLIGTWEGFEKTAKTVHDKSDGKTAFCDEWEGFVRAASCNLTEPWLNAQNETVIPESMKQTAERYVSFAKNGYFSDCRRDDEKWTQTVQSDALFGFFALSVRLPEDIMLFIYSCGEDSDYYGKFNLVQGPSAFNWPVDYLLVSQHCDNKALAYQFLNEFTVKEDTMTEFCQSTCNVTNNSAVMKKLAASDEGCEVFGGQKIVSLLDEIAAASHTPKEYSQSCSFKPDDFMNYVENAVLNNDPLDECYRQFCCK